MKKKRKKTDKPGNTEKCPSPVLPMSSSQRSFANNAFVHIACLVVLVLVIYSNTLNVPFQWDEDEFLVNNPIVTNLHYFASPSDAKGFQYYGHLMERYIGYLTFALDYKMHGFSVPGYHIVNIAIHVANAILVYLLVLLTFRTPFFLIKTDSGQAGMTVSPKSQKLSGVAMTAESRNSPYLLCHSGLSGIASRSFIAFFSAAIFAVHPLQTEAVTYVFQRFVPLAALFSLMSLTAYIWSRLAEGKQQSLLFYCIAFISAVLAMKTKEIAFTLPIVIALYEFCFFAPSPRVPVSPRLRVLLSPRLFYLAPMLLTMSIIPLTLMYLKGTAGGWTDSLPGSYGSVVLSRGEYMLTEFRVIITYLRLLFMPVSQNFDYDYPVFKSLFDPQVMLSFLFLSALFGLGIYLVLRTERRGLRTELKRLRTKGRGLRAKREDQNSVLSTQSSVLSTQSSPLSPAFRLIGFGILWFFITLAVESSIVPLDRLIDEYRVYLPSVGISIAVVTGVFLISERVRSLKAGKVILALVVLVVGVLAIVTYNRNGVWVDRIGLWEDTVKKSPGSAEAHYSLGVAYQNFDMPDKAMEQYLIAINLRPDRVEAHNNLGNIYKTFNMPDKALEQYLLVIKLKPDYAEGHFNLGSFLYYRMGQKEDARRELMEGLKIKPDDQEAQQLLNEISR